jgi:hypothetical protein
MLVLTLAPGTEIVVTVRDSSQPAKRYFVQADKLGLTVLNLSVRRRVFRAPGVKQWRRKTGIGTGVTAIRLRRCAPCAHESRCW